MISGLPVLTMMSRNVTQARMASQTPLLPAQAVTRSENRTGNWSQGKRIRPDVGETRILIDGEGNGWRALCNPCIGTRQVRPPRHVWR